MYYGLVFIPGMNRCTRHRYQCCGSEKFIPVPGSWFLSIPDLTTATKVERENFFCPTIFVATKPGSEIRDPEKKLLRIPDPGSKRHRLPDPDPQHWYLLPPALALDRPSLWHQPSEDKNVKNVPYLSHEEGYRSLNLQQGGASCRALSHPHAQQLQQPQPRHKPRRGWVWNF